MPELQQPGDSDVRDRLALDRTMLANERTLLAYVRTALALLGAGAALLHFFESLLAVGAGWAFVAVSFAVLVVGVMRFRTVRRHLAPGR